MTFNNWAYIYLGMGEEDPAVDRAVIERGGLRTTMVAVPEKSAAVQAAVELVDGGARSIELCGAFYRWTCPRRFGQLQHGVCARFSRALRADDVVPGVGGVRATACAASFRGKGSSRSIEADNLYESAGQKPYSSTDFLNKSAAAMLDELAWWTRTLKAGRVEEAKVAELVGAAR
jgi:Family of unknown function (DUF6506)